MKKIVKQSDLDSDLEKRYKLLLGQINDCAKNLGIGFEDYAKKDLFSCIENTIAQLIDELLKTQKLRKAKEHSEKNLGEIKEDSTNQLLKLLASKNSELDKVNSELARSNSDLSQFASVASHDLQAPLRHITSYIGMVFDKDLDPEKKQRWVKYITDGADKMRDLIADLLIYSRVTTSKKEYKKVDLAAVVTGVLEMLNEPIAKSGAKITVEKLPVVEGIKVNMIQLFQNLIGNALKFRKKDSDLCMQIEAKEVGDFWQISIKDNGIGIDPEHHQKAFQIFQRLNGENEYLGTGIGLAVCKKIVENHGGEIWIDSMVGKGCTFYFTILKKLAC